VEHRVSTAVSSRRGSARIGAVPMSDRANVFLVAAASALAGAKLQDIVKALLERRRCAPSRVPTRLPAGRPPRAPRSRAHS
jgi:hypothetical protein